MFDSALNLTAYLGNTTDNFFKVSNLKMGHNYTFTVQARCLFGSQICGEPAVLLYDELSSGEWLCGPSCLCPVLRKKRDAMVFLMVIPKHISSTVCVPKKSLRYQFSSVLM